MAAAVFAPVGVLVVGVGLRVDDPIGRVVLTMLGVCVALAAGIWVWLRTQHFAESVEEVTTALQGLARGESLLGATLSVPDAAETSQLVEAFNALSDHLQRNIDELAQSQRQFRQAIGRLGDALAGNLDLARILEVVLETAVATLGGHEGVFFTFPANRSRLEARVATPAAVTGTIDAGAGLAGAAAARSRTLRFPGDAQLVAPEPVCDAALACPFFNRGLVYGVVAVYGSDVGPFGQDQVETFEALVRQAETAVDNVFLHDEAKRLSITDGLTGLWNRREFELRTRQELERAARFGRSVALVMCDLDWFRRVNEGLGHPGGDAVLIELARRLKNSTREVDTVARYGGEEFVLVLPETDLKGASFVAEKIRRAVAEVPFEFESQTVDVTISLGVAAYPESGTSARELIAAADDALYQAKRAGKNRVEAATVFDADR
jgi:diguanylate cyclase (GGDEF)-like protein